MALSPGRIHAGGETPHPWERAAIDFVLGELPDLDPFQAWPLQDFSDFGSGRLYELDLLILGRRALYLIEIKSWPGRVEGDIRDWRISFEGRLRFEENPYYLTNTKAKVLASALKRKLDYPDNQLWVEPLVFLSHEQIDVQPLAEGALSHVVTRGNLLKALTHDEYPGSGASHRRPPVNRRQMKKVVEALHSLGLRPSQALRRVGEYRLGGLLREGPGYQEHTATHASLPDRARRVRSYLVPRATATDRRAQLERAARREAQVLEELGDHPNILSCREYVDNAPLGPALLFESFDGGLPLDMFLRLQPELSFDDRMGILQRVAEALSFCHGRTTLHRNLSPSAVLVRKRDGEPLEVKLHSFQLATQIDAPGTVHLTSMSEEHDLIYRAPEVLDDPAHATVASDVFSLGALACFVLSGSLPAVNIAERERTLCRDNHLRLSTLSDDFSPRFDEVIASATELHFANRYDDPIEWYALLEDAATSPAIEEQPVDLDPWQAKQGDELATGFVVERLLGSGTTARVFHVVHGDKHHALKVPHDDGCAERLHAEADVLARLRHQHIVQSHGMRRVGPRDCLLLDLAAPQQWRNRGDEPNEPRTLAELIRQQGPVALDYAKRFGDDLLSALQYLEEHGVQHRDIKPGNIGFTPSHKQARHLVLFDFSLSSIDASQVTAGTAGYRDPGLRLRGRWDAAADRYAAAVTLYEILVGLRLDPAPLGSTDENPFIRAERFDAAVRDRLSTFFNRALHGDADKRFASAEVMRHEWLGSLTAPARVATGAVAPIISTAASVAEAESGTTQPVETAPLGPSSSPTAAASTTATTGVAVAPTKAPLTPETPTPPVKEIFADVTLTTPVEALSLSAAAKSALDRSGIVNVQDLLQLPRNHLSAIRGVGHQVAREIQLAAELLRRHKGDQQPAPAFVPDYRGERRELHAGPPLGLSRAEAATLRDAGIHTTVDLAATALERATRLLGPQRAERLGQLLREHDESERPLRLAEWVEAVFPKSTKKLTQAERAPRALVGLEPLPEFPAPSCPSIAQVAQQLGVTRVTVGNGLKAARARWAETAHIEELITLCEDAVQGLGGICAFEAAAVELARREGHTSTGDDASEDLRHAAIVLRVVAELRGDDGDPESLHLHKVRGTWFLTNEPELIELARQLGGTADRLAERVPLASTARVQQSLARAVVDTPLAQLSPERLVRIAAAASERACASTRLELYPRNMSAHRTLDLSAAILSTGELPVDVLRKRVAARYPEADPLPDRPELDELLEGHGLRFDPARSLYRRPDMQPTTTVSATRMFATVMSTARLDAPLLDTPAANEARLFQEALRAAVERGRFRVLQVRSDLADQAALRLAEELQVEPTSLDALLYQHIEAERVIWEVDQESMIAADRLGPEDEDHWPLLTRLVGEAADKMVASLLDQRDKPRVLVAPGSFGRYALAPQLQLLIERAEHEEGAAVLLLVPSYDTGRPPTINNTLPVPAPLPGQRLKVPKSWLTNAHRAAAAS